MAVSVKDQEREKQKSFEASEDLRRRGVGAAYGVARVAGEAPGRLAAAGERARVSLRQRSAQALGSAMGQAGRMATGGGQAAALRQAALRSGAAEGAFSMEQAGRMAEARHQAAMSGLEAVKFEAEAGDPWGARREAINFYTTELIKAKAAEMSQAEMDQLVEDWLVAETDPVLIQWLRGRSQGAEEVVDPPPKASSSGGNMVNPFGFVEGVINAIFD